MNKRIELLAPAGDMERLKTAIYFGADAVYFAGKKFGLRAFSNNFDLEEISLAVKYCHQHNVKAYVTVNILAHNYDFEGMIEYLKFLDQEHVDGVIVADLGIASLVKQYTNLELHVSTQANITNKYSALMWVKLGAKRLVLARELSIEEIKEIKEAVGENIEIECFAHGAMCISYSGRCLLSNYFTHRDSNKGACAQPCRWNYALYSKYKEKELDGYYPIEEDSHGTYILNSKDMCLISHLKKLQEAGITSLKIEGRMKTPYYVATVVNAYRRAIDEMDQEPSFNYIEELEKTSHRLFTTGFYFNDDQKTNIDQSLLTQSHNFIGIVKEDYKDGYALIEMRNKFVLGDELEVLSPYEYFNQTIKVVEILDEKGQKIEIANKVQQRLLLKTNIPLHQNDILRKKIKDENEIKRQ